MRVYIPNIFRNRYFKGITLLVLLTVLPLTIMSLQKQQTIKQHAATTIASCQTTFTDLSTNVQTAVFCLNQNAYCVVRGFPQPDGTAQFAESDILTREQVVAFISRYHIDVLHDWPLQNIPTPYFVDVPSSNPLFLEIQNARYYGFLRGRDNGDNTFSFEPTKVWTYGFMGVNKSEYNDFTVETQPGGITRGSFVTQLHNYGMARGQLSACAVQACNRCSVTQGCTMANFQSNDSCKNPLPNTTTYSQNMSSCGWVNNANNANCVQSCSSTTVDVTTWTNTGNVIATAAGVKFATGVKFYVWSSENGQDDMKIYDGVLQPGGNINTGQTFKASINVANHPYNAAQDTIYVHAYLVNASRADTFCAQATFTSVKPTPTPRPVYSCPARCSNSYGCTRVEAFQSYVADCNNPQPVGNVTYTPVAESVCGKVDPNSQFYINNNNCPVPTNTPTPTRTPTPSPTRTPTPTPTRTPTPTAVPAPKPVAWDVNQDFVLNQKDIFPVIKTFNTKPPLAANIKGDSSKNVLAATNTDINNDGKINAFDYSLVAENIVNPLGIPAVNKSYDVVIVGAGTGGVAAAIQAARMGASVALIEETDWVGGQMSPAGVSTMDEGILFLRSGPESIEQKSGIYKEYVRKIFTDYIGEPNIHKCLYYPFSVCIEPSSARDLLIQMLTAARFSWTDPNNTSRSIFYQTTVTQVMKTGNKVTGVKLSNGSQFNSKVLIDATEYGDIIPMAGAEYRVGNSTSSNINMTAQIQDITYTAVIRQCTPGTAGCLKVPDFPPNPVDANGNVTADTYTAAKQHFMKYVQNDILSQYTPQVRWDEHKYDNPRDWVMHNAYRGLPDTLFPNNTVVHDYATAQTITKTGVNLANDYPGSADPNTPDSYVPPGLTVKYLEDKNYRKTVNCNAKLRTLQMIYYMQSNSEQGNWWSLAPEEGYQNSGYTQNGSNDCSNIPVAYKPLEHMLPLFPYVRESRRIIGITTITAKQVNAEKDITTPHDSQGNILYDPPNSTDMLYNYAGLKQIVNPSTIAIGGYNIDIHGCKEDSCLEGYAPLNEVKTDATENHGEFQIPIGALIPKTIDGFLAAEKNISVTRLVNGATRLQPITMLTGQAAGALAAIAASSNTEPRHVKPIDVQQALVAGSEGNLLFPAHLSLFRFSDAKIGYPTDPYSHSIQLVSVNKIITGFPDQTFGTTQPLTRGQAAIIMARIFPKINTDGTAVQYDDEQTAVAWLQSQQIIIGSSTYADFNPAANTTHSALALFLARALAKSGAIPVLQDPASGIAEAITKLNSIGISVGCQASSCYNTDVIRGEAADGAAATMHYSTNPQFNAP